MRAMQRGAWVPPERPGLDAPAARLPIQGATTRLRFHRLAWAIHSGSGAPSRCRPPADAPAHAAAAPSSKDAAREKARMMVLRRDRVTAVFAFAITLSTRRSAS